MNVLDQMIISLGLDPQGVRSGMAQAEGIVQSSVSKIGAVVQNIAAPLIGIFSAGKLFGSYLNEASALDQLSRSLGMDVERLQQWQGAARSAGVAADEIGNIFRDMNDYITDATQFDSGPLKEISAQLGIALQDVNGAARSSESVLLDLADAFKAVGEQEATGYGMQLSFDPGMIALLQQGSAELEELFRRQRELGTYTKEDAEIAARFARELGNLWQSLKAGSAIILRMVVPAMTAMIGWVQNIVKYLRDHEQAVQIFFVGLATVISAVTLPALKKLAVAALTNPFTLLIAGAAGLALALEDLYVWMNGGTAAFSNFWSLFGTPEEVKESLESLFAKIKAGAEAVMPVLKSLFQMLKDWGPALAGLGAAAAAIKGITAAGQAFSTVKTAIVGVGAAMKAVNAIAMANPLGMTFALLVSLAAVVLKNWDAISDGARALWDRVTSIFSGAISWFSSLFGGVGDSASSGLAGVANAATAAWDSIVSVFGGAVSWFAGLFGSAGEAISGGLSRALDSVMGLWGSLTSVFSETPERFGQIFGEAWQTVVSIFSGAIQWFGKVFEGIYNAIAGPIGKAFQKIKDGWSSVKRFFGFGDGDTPKKGKGGKQDAASPFIEEEAMASALAPVLNGAEQALPPALTSNTNYYNNTTSVNIGKIDVQTQAADADSISRDIGKGLERNAASFVVNQANSGVTQ